MDTCKLGVDLVRADSVRERFLDGLIEAGEQLEQAFTAAAHQHGVGAVFIGGRGNTTDWPEHADGDVAGFDQLRDMGQRQCGRR